MEGGTDSDVSQINNCCEEEQSASSLPPEVLPKIPTLRYVFLPYCPNYVKKYCPIKTHARLPPPPISIVPHPLRCGSPCLMYYGTAVLFTVS